MLKKHTQATMANQYLTHERLLEILDYEPEVGDFTWLKSKGGARAGSIAGVTTSLGYRAIRVDGRTYLAHRLAWFYVTGEWPVDQIDHVNRVRCDNSFSNLRQATGAENKQNRVVQKNSTSGFTGVSWHKPSQQWVAYINVGGKQRHLGRFSSKEDAAGAYISAKRTLHTFSPDI